MLKIKRFLILCIGVVLTAWSLVAQVVTCVNAGCWSVYEGKDPSNPFSYQQLRVSSPAVGSSTAYPDYTGSYAVGGGDTLASAGCSYYSFLYTLIKHGDVEPSEHAIKDLFEKFKGSGATTASWNCINFTQVTKVYGDIIEEALRVEGINTDNLVQQTKDWMSKGYFMIYCIVCSGGTNPTNGHYIAVDKVVGDDIYIMDSYGLENTWEEAYGKYGGYIAHANPIKFKDGRGPNDCFSMIDKYWAAATSSQSITGYDYAKIAIGYAYDSVEESTYAGATPTTNKGTKEYEEAHDKAFPGDIYYSSCDRSSATAVVISGADPNLPPGACTAQYNYLIGATDKWEYLGTNDDVRYEDLLPGDFFVKDGCHTMMYVGNDLIKSVKGSQMNDTLDTVEGSFTYARAPHVSTSVSRVFQKGYFLGLGNVQYKMHIFRFKGTTLQTVDNSSVSKELGGEIPDEWELEGMPDKFEWMQIYLAPLSRSTDSSGISGKGSSNVEYLTTTETLRVDLIGLDITQDRLTSYQYYLRIIPAVIGFFIILYGFLLSLAVLFDTNNNVVPVDMVNLITFGMCKVDTTGEVDYTLTFTHEKVISPIRLYVSALACIILGILILAGVFWTMLSILV